MARFKRITDMYGTKVFTDSGYFFGEVGEIIIEGNKLRSWKINSVTGSLLSSRVKDAKGVIIPHKFFRAFGDIIIVQEVDLTGKSSDEVSSSQAEQ